jgi:hypothetical protein
VSFAADWLALGACKQLLCVTSSLRLIMRFMQSCSISVPLLPSGKFVQLISCYRYDIVSSVAMVSEVTSAEQLCLSWEGYSSERVLLDHQNSKRF